MSVSNTVGEMLVMDGRGVLFSLYNILEPEMLVIRNINFN